MKLIETMISKGRIVEADQSKLPKGVLCRGVWPICNINELNQNNRIYEKEVWERVNTNKDIVEKLKNRTLYGQAEHPKETQSDLQLTSHIITGKYFDTVMENGKQVEKAYDRIDVLDTPCGRIINTLLEAGCLVGVSTRAEGDLEEAERDGKKFQRVIPESFKYVTTDFTADPSTLGTVPMQLEKNLVREIKEAVEHKGVTRKFASSLLEKMNGDDAKSLNSVIEKSPKCMCHSEFLCSHCDHCKGGVKENIVDEKFGEYEVLWKTVQDYTSTKKCNTEKEAMELVDSLRQTGEDADGNKLKGIYINHEGRSSNNLLEAKHDAGFSVTWKEYIKDDKKNTRKKSQDFIHKSARDQFVDQLKKRKEFIEIVKMSDPTNESNTDERAQTLEQLLNQEMIKIGVGAVIREGSSRKVKIKSDLYYDEQHKEITTEKTNHLYLKAGVVMTKISDDEYQGGGHITSLSPEWYESIQERILKGKVESIKEGKITVGIFGPTSDGSAKSITIEGAASAVINNSGELVIWPKDEPIEVKTEPTANKTDDYDMEGELNAGEPKEEEQTDAEDIEKNDEVDVEESKVNEGKEHFDEKTKEELNNLTGTPYYSYETFRGNNESDEGLLEIDIDERTYPDFLDEPGEAEKLLKAIKSGKSYSCECDGVWYGVASTKEKAKLACLSAMANAKDVEESKVNEEYEDFDTWQKANSETLKHDYELYTKKCEHFNVKAESFEEWAKKRFSPKVDEKKVVKCTECNRVMLKEELTKEGNCPTCKKNVLVEMKIKESEMIIKWIEDEDTGEKFEDENTIEEMLLDEETPEMWVHFGDNDAELLSNLQGKEVQLLNGKVITIPIQESKIKEITDEDIENMSRDDGSASSSKVLKFHSMITADKMRKYQDENPSITIDGLVGKFTQNKVLSQKVLYDIAKRVVGEKSNESKIKESISEEDIQKAFLVVMSGGEVGSHNKSEEFYLDGGKGDLVIKGFDDEKSGLLFSHRQNAMLSPGEKNYYHIKYRCIKNPGNISKPMNNESLSTISKNIKTIRIKEASTRAERDKVLELLEEVSGELLSIKEGRSVEVNILLQKVKEASIEVSSLCKLLESKAVSIKNLNKMNEQLKESIQKQNSLNEKKLVEQKNTLTEEHKHEIVKMYVNFKEKGSGLTLPQNSRALLEKCLSVTEVDDIFEQVRDSLRRDALRPSQPGDVMLVVEKKIDSKSSSVKESVSNAFSAM
jgi:DNA-directed RNA polymerase subunit RPC12/RpoP